MNYGVRAQRVLRMVVVRKFRQRGRGGGESLDQDLRIPLSHFCDGFSPSHCQIHVRQRLQPYCCGATLPHCSWEQIWEQFGDDHPETRMATWSVGELCKSRPLRQELNK